MVALVTGAAGFIGSHLCESLLLSDDEVVGIDSFTDYYPRRHKLANITQLRRNDRFRLIEEDLQELDLQTLLGNVDVVYHLAAQPGVRSSWGADFRTYVERNVLVTQRLLEACREQPPRKIVFASSSSVYGNAATYPTTESVRPQPISPYGVTKMASEHLCEVYRSNFGLRTASLRLFTVYGPRQRPDMALSRLVRCAIKGGCFELYGDGNQTRDLTFVDDVVNAMRDAANSDWVGVANVGGGLQVSLNGVIAMLSELGSPVEVLRKPASPGDVRDTAADTSVAADGFGYRPGTKLEEGLRAMIAWGRAREGDPR